MKIILPGGAGLVGQNLVVLLKQLKFTNIVVLDKHKTNLAILQKHHPDIICEYADLAELGSWQEHFAAADVVVMLQAQIGGISEELFVRNNIESTKIILEQVKRYNIPSLIHISSSVVNSVAKDLYTNTKKTQENLVLNSGMQSCILRPTLMFGWFDRKHLGWLQRFMHKVPVFPIPGNGQYLRQPLYVHDFCNIIISCIKNNSYQGIYDISGHEHINYIDIIKAIKNITMAKAKIIKLPYKFFYMLLKIWEIFDRNPPFTTQQLEALIAKDDFKIIDWPTIFGVTQTPFTAAINATFNDPIYSKIVLEF
jgi:nucleoside-diphosphate-sugar epimerase